MTRALAIPAGVMTRQVGDEVVILDLASGVYFGLDGVGARTWQLLAAGKSLAQAVEILLGEYDVQRDDLDRDLNRLLAELLAHGLLREE